MKQQETQMPSRAATPVGVIQRLVWKSDRMLLDSLVFRLEHYRSDDWDLGDECFVFFKTKGLIDQYAKLWASREDFMPKNIFELGIWEGGSIPFWFECFQPEKLVSINLREEQLSEYFRRYVRSRGLENRIKTYWDVNQADRSTLREIVSEEFQGPLDLIIDDASHQYHPTKASFETLFPLLRPGGLYIIEDWSWSHLEDFLSKNPEWLDRKPPADLIPEIIAAAGSRPGLICGVAVYPDMVVIERGEMPENELVDFELARHIYRHPAHTLRSSAIDLQVRPPVFIAAVPNPVPAGFGAEGRTIISWDTGDGSIGEVYVSVNHGEEKLFARHSCGIQEAPWINDKGVCEFRLYRGPGRTKPLGAVSVTRNRPLNKRDQASDQ